MTFAFLSFLFTVPIACDLNAYGRLGRDVHGEEGYIG